MSQQIEEPRILTVDEAHQHLDRETRLYLDLSADEFLAAADRGELDDDQPIVRHLLMLAGVDPSSC